MGGAYVVVSLDVALGVFVTTLVADEAATVLQDGDDDDDDDDEDDDDLPCTSSPHGPGRTGIRRSARHTDRHTTRHHGVLLMRAAQAWALSLSDLGISWLFVRLGGRGHALCSER